MILTKQKIQQFQKIIFEPCDDSELDRLRQQQRQKLRIALAQKIAFEAVYKKSYPQKEPLVPQNNYRAPNILAKIFCCFYPEDYKEQFTITGSLFATRFLRTFLFWKEDFLQIDQQMEPFQPKLLAKPQKKNDKSQKSNKNIEKTSDIPQLIVVKEIKRDVVKKKQDINQNEEVQENLQKGPDLYGPLWLTVTYIIILALSANFNDYFSFGSNPSYKFQKDYFSATLALTLFIRIVEIIAYPAIVGCLGGQVTHTQSAYLVGYSLALYFIPTILCSLASKQIHVICLLLAGFLRFVFLGRNYSYRLLDNKIICYTILLAAQILYYFMISSTFFSHYYVGTQSSAMASQAPKQAHLLRSFMGQSLRQ